MTHTADDMHDDSPASRPMTIDSKALEAGKALEIIRDVAYTTALKHREEGRHVLADKIDAALAALPPPKVEEEPVAWRVTSSNNSPQYFNEEGTAEQWGNSAGIFDSVIEPLYASPVLADEGVAGWQPIETAPKDGTWISLWRGASQTGTWSPLIIARWYAFSDDDASWVWPDNAYDVFTGKGREAAEEKISNGDLYEDARNFTHWQPLLTPPAVTP